MGRDAAITKKRVLTKVEDCRQAVNEMIGAVETLETQHNALCQAQDLAHADLERRATAASAWCEANEKGIATVARDVAEYRRLVNDVLANHAAGIESLLSTLPPPRGVWARLRWLLFGPTKVTAPSTSWADVDPDR